MIDTNCINDNLDNIHPYTTRPLDLEEKTFTKLFQNDIHNLMNICNWHFCNPTCYKTNVDVSKKYVGVDSLNLYSMKFISTLKQDFYI